MPSTTFPEIAAASDARMQTTSRRDKRALILEAAIRVFARMGYHGARVSDIAREAGIAYGLVYHYFKNKEEILVTIFGERWDGFLEGVDRIAESETSTEEKLVSLAAFILDAYRLRPEWMKVFVLEIQRSSRFAEPAQIRSVSRLFDAVAKILRAGQAAGEVRAELDPDIACYVLIGALEIALTALVLELVDPEVSGSDADAYIANVAQTVVEVFLRGVSRGESAR